MSTPIPPDYNSENHPDNLSAWTPPKPPGRGISQYWPVVAGVAGAVFLGTLALSSLDGSGVEKFVRPALVSAAYLIMTVRVAGKSKKGLLDYALIAVTASALPLFYFSDILIGFAPREWVYMNTIIHSFWAAVFALTYYAWSFRAAYPPAPNSFDWALIIPVILMSVILGLIITVQLAWLVVGNLHLIEDLPSHLVYTFSSVVFFLDSLVVIAGALAKLIKTRHAADGVQLAARVLYLGARLAVQAAILIIGSSSLGPQTISFLYTVPASLFTLVFAVAFFAAPDPGGSGRTKPPPILYNIDHPPVPRRRNVPIQ